MASLRDIAQAAGVSIRTVNRVLKDSGYVAPETREQVQAVVRELGYQPNRAARSLKTRRSYEIAVAAWSTDELHMQKIAGLERRLRGEDYVVNILIEHDETDGKDVINELIDRHPAGVAMFSHGKRDVEADVDRLTGAAIPYVMLDYSPTGVDSIRIDRQRGVYEAVQYLWERGRRRIAYLGHETGSTRWPGYERAVGELRVEPVLIRPGAGANQYDGGRRAAESFMAMNPRPDAVQAYTDIMALGFLAGLHERGVCVPDDVAVVGFDGRAASATSWPPLTTVMQPNLEVGKATAEVLLGKIRGETAPADGWSRTLPTRLVVRETA